MLKLQPWLGFAEGWLLYILSRYQSGTWLAWIELTQEYWLPNEWLTCLPDVRNRLLSMPRSRYPDLTFAQVYWAPGLKRLDMPNNQRVSDTIRPGSIASPLWRIHFTGAVFAHSLNRLSVCSLTSSKDSDPFYQRGISVPAVLLWSAQTEPSAP